MNNVTKHIIYLLSRCHYNNSIKVANIILHNRYKDLGHTNTMEYINSQGYDLNEARKRSFIMLKSSPYLWCKGPTPLYINDKQFSNNYIYAYLGKYKNNIMYTKYTVNKRNKNVLMFNSWHVAKNPNDSRFKLLRENRRRHL